MLKFLFVGGLLLALLLNYTHQGSSPSPSPEAASSTASSGAPWAGIPLGGRTFWEDQARAGTALWKSSLRWCQKEYVDQNQPTITQGVCTLVLSVDTDLQGTTSP